MKRIPLFTVPSYFLSMASAVVMMDAFAAMSFMKGCLFAFPFMTFLVFSTYMTQQSSVIVSRIELLKTKELTNESKDTSNKDEKTKANEEEKSEDEESASIEDQYAEEVIIENLRGEVARISISDIKPLNAEIAKQFILQ